MVSWFEYESDADKQIGELSLRLQRLIESSVTYHSLIQPERTLTYKIYMGEKWQYPRLTDTSTLDGVLTKEAGLEPILEFKARSTVKAHSYFSPHYFAGNNQIIDQGVRYILLTPDDATDVDVEEHQSNMGKKVRVYRKLEHDLPKSFDAIREVMRLKRESNGRKHVEPFVPETVESINSSGNTHHPWVEIAPGKPNQNATSAVIVGMHWLQAGGAERWALETVKIAKESGFTPIIITDRDSHQPWITNEVFDNTVIINLTHPLQDRIGDIPLLRAIFEQYNVSGVLIHHCQWLYDRLWWIKKYFPDTRVVDSLHIVEYVNNGGYPRESVARDEWIDIHHVISPQLKKWLVDTHHIDANKVVMAPLIGLTAQCNELTFKKRVNSEELTVAFIGRMARQKRPEAFILAAKSLSDNPNIHFIMHGSGDMDDFVRDLIHKYKLENSIEIRSMDVPVSQTYTDSDVLLISSVNEGITLTTIEALTAGVPVLSANVGSQDTLIPVQGLLRRMTSQFIYDAKRSLQHLLKNEDDRRKLWEVEKTRLQEFASLRSAEEYFITLLNGWK